MLSSAATRVSDVFHSDAELGLHITMTHVGSFDFKTTASLKLVSKTLNLSAQANKLYQKQANAVLQTLAHGAREMRRFKDRKAAWQPINKRIKLIGFSYPSIYMAGLGAMIDTLPMYKLEDLKTLIRDSGFKGSLYTGRLRLLYESDTAKWSNFMRDVTTLITSSSPNKEMVAAFWLHEGKKRNEVADFMEAMMVSVQGYRQRETKKFLELLLYQDVLLEGGGNAHDEFVVKTPLGVFRNTCGPIMLEEGRLLSRALSLSNEPLDLLVIKTAKLSRYPSELLTPCIISDAYSVEMQTYTPAKYTYL